MISWALPAAAHVSERGLVMLLPTGFYQLGGAVAVMASFLALAILPEGWFRDLTKMRVALFPWRPAWRDSVSLLAFALVAALVAIGRFGTSDPLQNLLPLTVWTMGWVGLTLFQAGVGNLWPWLNPWTGPLALFRRLTGSGLGRVPRVRLPARIGYLPAILVFSGFAWFELVSLSPQDPPQLAGVVLCYWLFTLIAMMVFGAAGWARRGEPFSIFFRLVGMLAPVSALPVAGSPGRRKLCLTWPGRRCLTATALPLSGTLFVLLTLASVSFDGFSATFTWLGAIGINPLEFPGRSAVTAANTVGLFGAFVLLATLFFGAVYAGNALAGVHGGKALVASTGLLIYSIIPISIAFHASHYMTILMINGQYFITAISDPFSRGWNLLGTADMHVTNSFMNTLGSVRMIWIAQTVLIVAGHVIGVLLAHMLALRHFGTTAKATRSQLFLAVVMVFYTIFGLWLLSTPVA